ncbi:hypothetical protein H072_2988 [Dactylellina haptotyla CBS 200.50]|uniref:Uncharacterized protein n=1 Tax=Dactylellina haptotyla (strain CBS 200.50) TaxID=1284197 RepID=S8AJD4_DACHA|nr:hypothetical protein H072_2988 [Dactylellina haptotyla CBS 200.50]
MPDAHTKYAHAEGLTFVTYTIDGKYLLTAGSNNLLRKFTHGSSDEPDNIDQTHRLNTGICGNNENFYISCEDGLVESYSIRNNEMDKLITRFSLPARDVAVTPDGYWVAACGDDINVKVVNTRDTTKHMVLRHHSKPIKHITFDPSGSLLACSSVDGVIYVYSLTTETPDLLHKITGVISEVDVDSEVSTRAAWHPDGRALAVGQNNMDIAVVSRQDWGIKKIFAGGHSNDVSALAWSKNGGFLVSGDTKGNVTIWESKNQNIVARYRYDGGITSVSWHPTENIISFGTTEGTVITQPEAVPSEHEKVLNLALQPAPGFLPAGADFMRLERQAEAKKEKAQKSRRGSVDDILNALDEENGDDWLVDDDGAGYGEKNENGKRKAVIPGLGMPSIKRHAYGSWEPDIHEPMQPGSTPWRGDRRYLFLSLIGFVWTVDQKTHNTVTVEFYDQEQYRNFHFTDPLLYDKAVLNENGALFSSPPGRGNPALLFYREHETWGVRHEWKTRLPDGEEVVSIALSSTYVVACTSNGYVRIYSLYGVPVMVYRQKHTPVVSCTSWRDYVMILGNGPVTSDGRAQLTYTIENIRRNEIIQNNDAVALPDDAIVKNIFFSEDGNPMIYVSTGVLLVLQHWRNPGQARWVPLLDTTHLDRRIGGKKEETYWPVAVSQDKFCCIILKGGEKYPYFPRPLLSEFDFRVPVSNPPDEDESKNDAMSKLEESFVRESVLVSLTEDLIEHTRDADNERIEVVRRNISIDKTLLQMLALECKEEDKQSKCLEIVGLMKQPRTLEMAMKVAEKYERRGLVQKIEAMRDQMEED